MEERLPNFVIAGVNKAGTTSLFSYLVRHSQVCGSSVKETCYFLPIRYGEEPAPLERYRQFFTACRDADVVMESTPGYFYGGGEMADAMRRSLDDLKVAIILREPVSRLLSFFRFQKSMLALPATMTLDEYIAACDRVPTTQLRMDRTLNPWFGIEGGRYDRYLEGWLTTFGTNVRILFFDDLVTDPLGTVEGLGTWLGLDASEFQRLEFATENRTMSFRSGVAQRSALAVNQRLEGLFRARPRLKRRLREMYQRVNAQPSAETVPAGLKDELHARYRASNQVVGSQLYAAGYSTLPPWLEPGKSGSPSTTM